MPTLKIDQDKCIGCGLCASMCAEVFEMTDEWKARVKDASKCGSESCDCKSVAESCPVDAITYQE